jgi:aminoglycoside/choline kinase family phosphotransferase
LSAIGAAVPAIYATDLAAGVLLLEDVGDTFLWDRASASAAEAERWYRSAIDALLVIHQRGTAHPDRSSIAFKQRFDDRLYPWELEHFVEYGVERRLGAPLEPAARAAMQASFDAMVAELVTFEQVLCHRDYHSWNILVAHDRIQIIDFQDALLAPPEYDLASLLTDRITPRIVTPAMEARLLSYYWSARGETAGASHRRRYLLTALHRVLKVIGRIHYVALEKQKPAPLAFVPDVVATARRLLAELGLPGGLAEQFARLPWPEGAPP